MSSRHVGPFAFLLASLLLALHTPAAAQVNPNDMRSGTTRATNAGTVGTVLFNIPAGQRFVLTDFHYSFGKLSTGTTATTLTIFEGMTPRWASRVTMANTPLDLHWSTGLVFSAFLYLVQDEAGDMASYDWIASWSGYLTSATLAVTPTPDPVPSADLSLSVSPNPTDGSSMLRFVLARDQQVSIAIFDVAGRQVRSLWDGPMSRSSVAMPWDGRNDAGARVESGHYFARVQTADGLIGVSKFTKVD